MPLWDEQIFPVFAQEPGHTMRPEFCHRLFPISRQDELCRPEFDIPIQWLSLRYVLAMSQNISRHYWLYLIIEIQTANQKHEIHQLLQCRHHLQTLHHLRP